MIRPRPGGSLTHAKATYHSIRGEIASGWRVDGDDLTLEVTIPASTTATGSPARRQKSGVTHFLTSASA